MACATCGTVPDDEHWVCPVCNTPAGSPAVEPDVPTFPLAGHARAAIIGMGVFFVAGLGLWMWPIVARRYAETARQTLDGALIDRLAMIENVLALVCLCVLVGAGALVAAWLYRARRNLEAFPGATPQLAPFWAYASWVVPFANIIVPYQVVAQVARGSLWGTARRTGLVLAWWFCLVAAVVFGGTAWYGKNLRYAELPVFPEFPREFQEFVDYYAGREWQPTAPIILLLVAGVLLVVVIRDVTRGQERRMRQAETV